jgi:hypothetical protein
MDDTKADELLIEIKKGLKNLTQEVKETSPIWSSQTMSGNYNTNYDYTAHSPITIHANDLTTFDPGVFSITTPAGITNLQQVAPIVGLGNSISPNTIWSSTGTTNAAKLSSDGIMELHGDNADIVINGQSLTKMLAGFEERLNWLKPNPELEKEWNELKELGDRYREIEARCKEKAKIWEKLKSMPPPTNNI